jgi:hypothetical protein
VQHFKGFSSIVGVLDRDGLPVNPWVAAERGWFPVGKAPADVKLGDDEVPLAVNLQLDNFRQYMAYAMTFRAPVGNYVLQRFGVGTGTAPPTTADVQLGNQIPLVASDNPSFNTRLVDYAQYPSPFLTQIYFTLAITDAVGYLVTEMGLYSGDQTLLVHWLLPAGIQGGVSSLQFCHRLAW